MMEMLTLSDPLSAPEFFINSINLVYKIGRMNLEKIYIQT